MTEKTIAVLSIEERPEDISILKRYLERDEEGLGRIALTNAVRLSTGCELLSQGSYDAVLLDLVLPQASGLEAFLKVHGQKPQLPIVVLAGLQDEDLAKEALSLGAQDYLIKGAIDSRLLQRSIRYAIEKRRLAGLVETLLEQDGEGKLIADAKGQVLFANAAAARLLEKTTAELVGRPLPFPAGLDRVSAGASGRRRLELRAADVEWDGRPRRLWSLRDVTESESLARRDLELAESARALALRNDLMGSVSHELRNPLTTAKTAVRFLEEGSAGPLTPRQAQFVKMISRSVDRQIKIVTNVQDFTKLQAADFRLEFRPVDLFAVVAEIAEEFALSGASQRLEIDIQEGLPPINGDADLVGEVLRNLLDNAYRFARSKVVIRAVDAPPAGVAVCVADDGLGIPADRLGKLFQRYVQLERVERRGYKGTGLGLAICKEIVARHNGRIWADSAVGKGTRFSFVLPARAAAVSQPVHQ